MSERPQFSWNIQVSDYLEKRSPCIVEAAREFASENPGIERFTIDGYDVWTDSDDWEKQLYESYYRRPYPGVQA